MLPQLSFSSSYSWTTIHWKFDLSVFHFSYLIKLLSSRFIISAVNGEPSPLGGSTRPRWKAACFDFCHTIFFKAKQDSFHPGPVLPPCGWWLPKLRQLISIIHWRNETGELNHGLTLRTIDVSLSLKPLQSKAKHGTKLWLHELLKLLPITTY